MFWNGFEKRAALAGGLGGSKFMKGIKSGLSQTGKGGLSVGARPRSGVTVAGPFRPNSLPVPKPPVAAQNIRPAVSSKVPSAPVPKPNSRLPELGGASTTII
jgi:hypothetical protein